MAQEARAENGEKILAIAPRHRRYLVSKVSPLITVNTVKLAAVYPFVQSSALYTLTKRRRHGRLDWAVLRLYGILPLSLHERPDVRLCVGG